MRSLRNQDTKVSFWRVLVCAALGLMLAFPLATYVVYADVDPSTEGYEIPEANTYGDEQIEDAEVLRVHLSTPDVTRTQENICYATQLTIEGISAFYGYQIEVESASEESVTITNQVGGLTTSQVYKEGQVYQAVMLSEGEKDDITICTITIRYPLDDTNQDRQLVVRKIQAITDIRTESVLVLGPDPAAAILLLPYLEAAAVPLAAPEISSIPLWVFLLLILGLFIIVLLIWLLARKRKVTQRPSHSR